MERAAEAGGAFAFQLVALANAGHGTWMPKRSLRMPLLNPVAAAVAKSRRVRSDSSRTALWVRPTWENAAGGRRACAVGQPGTARSLLRYPQGRGSTDPALL